MSAPHAALVLCLSLCACGMDHAHPHDEGPGHGVGGGHGHGGRAIGITRWTDTLELFAEHPPAAVGHELPFLAHLTVLDGFRALEGARVRLSLDGPAQLSAEADMLRPGIYRPVVTPTAPGEYRGRLEIVSGSGGPSTALGTGVIDGLTIMVFATEAEAVGYAEEDERSGAIEFLKEQQWRVPFATELAARATIAETIEAPGELTTPPEGRAHVHAPVAGRVAAPPRGFPVPGRAVIAGEELATIAPTPGAPEDAARASLAVVEAESEREAARAALERSERLLADRAVPERAVADARRRLAVAEASVSTARRAQGMFASASRGARGRGGWRVTAPIAGVIDDVAVTPGEAVEANELLFRVVDPERRWLSARVPEAWAPRMRPEGGVSFRLLGEEGWRALRGSLVDVGRSVDPRSRTVQVIWALEDAAPELRVGASAEIAIPIGEATEAIVVPRAAVIDAEGRDVVIVQLEGESFDERAVRTGPAHGGRVAVLDGLEAGERVVTRGAYLVRLAARAAEGGGASHGHVH